MSGHPDLSLHDVYLYDAGVKSGRLDREAEIARLTRELEEARAELARIREATLRWSDRQHEALRALLRAISDAHRAANERERERIMAEYQRLVLNTDDGRQSQWAADLIAEAKRALATPQEASEP